MFSKYPSLFTFSMYFLISSAKQKQMKHTNPSQRPDGLSQSDVAFMLVVVIIIGLCLESWIA